jgi:hypothetical protein
MAFPKFPALLSLLILAAAPSIAEATNIEGLKISVGDTLGKVQEAYQTTREPEPERSAGVKNATSLRLKSKGVWFFFDQDKIYTIRLEAPFAGSVNGLKIGDSEEKMREVLGKPVKVVKPFVSDRAPRNYIYHLDDITTANVEVNPDNEVETIFLVK